MTPFSLIGLNCGCERTALSPPVLGSSKNLLPIFRTTQLASPSAQVELLTSPLVVSPPTLSCRSVIGYQMTGENMFAIILSLCMPFTFPNHIPFLLNFFTTLTSHFFLLSQSFFSPSLFLSHSPYRYSVKNVFVINWAHSDWCAFGAQPAEVSCFLLYRPSSSIRVSI